MKKIYIAGFMAAFLLSGCSENTSSHDAEKQAESIGQNIVDQVNNVVQAQDEHVLGVKNGHPSSYPQCSYGDVFDNFFGSPTWTYFESTTGEDVVEFTGYCMYQDVEVKARLQFILDEGGDTFSAGALSFNDVPQANLVTISLLDKAFEEYMDAYGISADQEGDLEEELSEVFTPQSATPMLSTAIEYGIWSDTDELSWYSPTTGYYMITFADSGAATLEFATENTTATYASLYYVDNITFETRNDELISTGEIYPASKSERNVLGQITVNWGSAGKHESPMLTMVDGGTFSDFSIFADDYTYVGGTSDEANVSDDSGYVGADTPYYADEGDAFMVPHVFLENSSSLALRDEDIYFYTPEELRYAKNEIYARHGRRFKDPELQAWFDAQSWYNGTIPPEQFREDVLTQVEKDNIGVIQHRMEVNSR